MIDRGSQIFKLAARHQSVAGRRLTGRGARCSALLPIRGLPDGNSRPRRQAPPAASRPGAASCPPTACIRACGNAWIRTSTCPRTLPVSPPRPRSRTTHSRQVPPSARGTRVRTAGRASTIVEWLNAHLDYVHIAPTEVRVGQQRPLKEGRSTPGRNGRMVREPPLHVDGRGIPRLATFDHRHGLAGLRTTLTQR
jgi:hypothetical protein